MGARPAEPGVRVASYAAVASYSEFFTASVTVAGALVGLLFVALSLSPEQLRDSRSVEHQAIAATAFTALVDALFVSLIALQPGGGLDYGAVIFGALGLSSTIGLALRLWRNRHLGHLSNRWPFFLGIIMAVYAAQLASGIVPQTPAARPTGPRRSSTCCSVSASPAPGSCWA